MREPIFKLSENISRHNHVDRSSLLLWKILKNMHQYYETGKFESHWSGWYWKCLLNSEVYSSPEVDVVLGASTFLSVRSLLFILFVFCYFSPLNMWMIWLNLKATLRKYCGERFLPRRHGGKSIHEGWKDKASVSWSSHGGSVLQKRSHRPTCCGMLLAGCGRGHSMSLDYWCFRDT